MRVIIRRISDNLKGIFITSFICFQVFLTGACAQNVCDNLQCNQNAKFSVEFGKSYPINASKLLIKGFCYDRNYKLEYLSKGVLYPLDTLTYDLPPFLKYHLTDLSNGNDCWGFITLNRVGCGVPFNPIRGTKSYNLFCYESSDVDDIGFNIPDSVELIKTGEKQFVAVNWARCGAVKISIVKEDNLNGNCDTNFQRIIRRTWRVTSPDNRQFEFKDTITVSYWDLDSTYVLPNYNGIDNPIFDCRDSWKRGRNGNPDGSLSFEKAYRNCQNLGTNYSDDTLSIQPEGCHRILELKRNWIILDWCKGEVIYPSQLVYVRCYNDSLNPTAMCKSGIVELQLNQNNVISVNANELIQDVNDNCGVAQISWDESGVLPIKQFSLADTGKLIDLKVWVTDSSGNKSVCDIQLKILPNQIVDTKNDFPSQAVNMEFIPNPSIDRVELVIHAKNGLKGNFYFYNQSGVKLLSIPVDFKNQAYWKFKIDEQLELKPGVYYGFYRSDQFIKAIKLLVL